MEQPDTCGTVELIRVEPRVRVTMDLTIAELKVMTRAHGNLSENDLRKLAKMPDSELATPSLNYRVFNTLKAGLKLAEAIF